MVTKAEGIQHEIESLDAVLVPMLADCQRLAERIAANVKEAKEVRWPRRVRLEADLAQALREGSVKDCKGLPVLWKYDAREPIGVCVNYQADGPEKDPGLYWELKFNERGRELLRSAVDAGTISIHVQDGRSIVIFHHQRLFQDNEGGQ